MALPEQLTTDGVYYRFRSTETKTSTNVPIVNIDSENYMLRGVNPTSEQDQRQRSQSFSFQRVGINRGAKTSPEIDLDKFTLRETASSLATVPDQIPNSYCARIFSFHSLLCTCRISCCCMCGSLCPPDCHACFHKVCLPLASNYICQRNPDVLPPATLDNNKVRLSNWIS